ncbi:helix-hairpin-helix domain-containing protein [Brachybacterium sp. J144]|uniref:helix-hairpin-helix domain-containing protein n=1 Tax=Brachybacterium sp. J144 TaxID=3116487 RepID=UPI002E782747|nr:helix-hairpin-helix domain-containing protein [Brachybacterium sp. J144]MEE1650985.1 helix-hairpin-helix domain-containing protein [Brachybacterium sp. J144]
MGASREAGRGSRRAARHRRASAGPGTVPRDEPEPLDADEPLVRRLDHAPQRPSRLRRLPAPTPAALVGLAVLVLIAGGVIHLSSAGTAVPLDETAATGEEVPTGASDTGSGAGNSAGSGATAPTPSEGPSTAPEDSAGAEAESTDEVVVHVSGAVTAPGLVRLPAGSRVDDALRAAGGTTEEADLSAINLARPLTDGEQVHVPRPGEEPPPVAAAPAGSSGEPGAGDGAPASAASPIDLNTATVQQLVELPGVGPAIAQRIVDHREANGPFTSVDDLLEVSGIGPATLEKIRPLATV